MLIQSTLLIQLIALVRSTTMPIRRNT
jgi:hypothetical protein